MNHDNYVYRVFDFSLLFGGIVSHNSKVLQMIVKPKSDFSS